MRKKSNTSNALHRELRYAGSEARDKRVNGFPRADRNSLCGKVGSDGSFPLNNVTYNPVCAERNF